jgi:hypothetical protein
MAPYSVGRFQATAPKRAFPQLRECDRCIDDVTAPAETLTPWQDRRSTQYKDSLDRVAVPLSCPLLRIVPAIRTTHNWPQHHRMRVVDRDLIRGGHYGQRSCEPHTQAEHMGATDQVCHREKCSCQPGAVHTWPFCDISKRSVDVGFRGEHRKRCAHMEFFAF